MNLHYPQSETTRTEIKELMMVGDNIVSGQSNRPVMGIIQDSLLASYKMTHDDIFIDKAEAMNLIMKIRKEVKLPPPCIMKPSVLWSGKQLFSLLFPDDLSYKRGDVEIYNGYYCQGVMSKKHLGTSERGMIHTMWLEYGPEYTTFFISNTQFLVNHWLFHHGFTVGIGDAITSKSVQQRVKSTIKESEDKVRQFISVSKHSNMEDIFEKKINQVLNNAMAVSGRIVQDTINRKNNIYTMVNGGSKGSVINIAQIMGVVGQQNVNGQRITLGNEDRTLCHFEKNDNNPAPKGFVKNSYYKGLDPHEFFYHAMGGREGIIDTAVKSITGDSLLMIDNGNSKEMITIGDFVDGYLEKEKENVVYYDQKNANMELLNINGYKIATIDSYGNSSWEEITKITRHDPSQYIYKIKTKFGREVRVVESKSLLVWNGNTYQPKMTNEVVVGDLVPVVPKMNEQCYNAVWINDTIQDPIISIEKELSNGKKVYDLTIPETNNFGLANGLMVYDTADTGYIQRRLIKSMEDLKVHRDYSLRNSIGEIVQFFYGDDRMNPVYVRGYTLRIPGEEEFSAKEKLYIKKYGNMKDIYNSEIKTLVPFDIEYQLKRLKKKNTKENTITYEEWEESINSFCDSIVMNVEDKCMTEHLEASNNYILLYVRVVLSSKNVIEKHKLTNEVFNELLDTLNYYFRKALVAPGEMMGTIAAQSLGEPTTQLTLNSFHFSGISAKNITLGVPRFKELINVLKNVKTPSMTLYVDDIEDVERVSIELENCILGDLIKEVYNVSKLEAFDIDESYIDGNYMNTAIKVVLNKRAILDRKIEYIDISIALLKNGLHCVCNDEKYHDMYLIVLLEEKEDYNDDDYIDHIYTLLYNKVHIKGHEGISKCYISENNIDTDGSCLGDVFMNSSINYKKSISNIPIEVLEILGIEATRTLLMNEIRKVLEFDGGYINPKHFCTLVDVMTHKGYLMSITRHGINKNETGPLMRCSFEETMDVLTDASTFAEKDDILGVSESITIGKMCDLGTGMCDMIMNSIYDDNTFEIEELSDEETESYYPCYEESYYPE